MPSKGLDRDEKVLRVIDLMHQNMKMVIDVATKGIVFHLGITAYSATFAFDRSPSAKVAIIILNLLVNLISGIGILLVARSLNHKRIKIVALYEEIGVDIGATPGRTSSLTRTTHFYALFCATLAVFWIVSFWLPAKPASLPQSSSAQPTATP